MSPDRQAHDLFAGDPVFEFEEYHQDYREESPLTRASIILPFLVLLAAATYHLFYSLDYDLLPLPELFWNCLVYITPSRLLDAAESYTNPLRITNPELKHIPHTHAAKSEAMRRILGLDTAGGIMNSVTQAGRRRLSVIHGIKLGSQDEDGRPPGLGNWDNSCYQNSVLQGLASLDPLADYLTNPDIEDEATEATPKLDMKMVEALRGLITTLNDPANNGRRIWTPATLKSMSSWQQQDAQEYFSKVLDAIDKEFNNVAKSIKSSPGFEMLDNAALVASKVTQRIPISAFRSPLEGTIAQRVGCTRCGYSEGLSVIPFNCLTVPLGRALEYDVTECLDEYTKLEPIDGVECGRCTMLKMEGLLSTIQERVKDDPDSPVYKNTVERLAAVTEALEENNYDEKTLLKKCGIPSKNRVSTTKSRQAVISRPPKSLVVHFNRSLFDELTGEMRKNYADVRFPKILDLGPWSLGSTGTSMDSTTEEWLLSPDQPMIASSARPSRLRGPMYELRAVVTHYGRHENGHYVCFKKHPRPTSEETDPKKQQWWRLSDDNVMKVSEMDVLSQGGVFMLFYDCVEAASLISSSSPSPETQFTIIPTPSALEAAVGIPLPEVDDSDLGIDDHEFSPINPKEASTTAAPSEYDDDDNEEHETQDYRPTQPIIVPPYIPKPGVHSNSEATGQQGIVTSGSLLMV
jgi:ubiquitin carboxyl-terminal hydrolase 1